MFPKCGKNRKYIDANNIPSADQVTEFNMTIHTNLILLRQMKYEIMKLEESKPRAVEYIANIATWFYERLYPAKYSGA
jgi:hypothetical protein